MRKKRGLNVDIQSHHALCEMNYHRLLRLMPRRLAGETHWQVGIIDNGGLRAREEIQLAQPSDPKLGVSIAIIEQAPYTTTVQLEQSSFLPLLKKPKVLVRLYHDASMAEIVGWDRHRNWHPHYLYPNEKMYLPDEKLGLNKFLADWLVFCCKHGYFINNKCDGVLGTTKY